MSALKKLAGQTAIYGVPSILGRFLNYILVVLHTNVLNTDEYGIYNDLFTYTALLLMVYTFGMETTFFRFGNKEDPKTAYQNAGSYVFFLSTLLTIILIVFAGDFANLLEYPGKSHYIVWMALILWIDSLVALPFAKLRFENKPVRFATLRMANIVIVICLQLFFFLVLPKIYHQEILAFLYPVAKVIYRPDFGVEYIILAMLLGNLIFIVLLFKSIIQIKFKIRFSSFKPMFWYALPITLTSIAGIINERLDVVLIGNFLPDDFYPGKSSEDIQGIYSASVKLSILLILGTQAFRFAAEPFFFSQAQDRQAPELFAKVFKYFAILAVIVFVGVSVNKDFIAMLLLQNAAYREALMIVPYLLLGRLFFGLYTNLTIWFKITDKTIYGTFFQVTGAILTVFINVLLIPQVGYMAPAIASIFAYFTMCVLCYYYGQKYFPIPYKLFNAFLYILSGILIILFSDKISFDVLWINYLVKLTISLSYVLVIYFIERKNLNTTV